jgi:hypothetical protein
MHTIKVEFEEGAKIQEIISAIEDIIGDSAHQILAELIKMNQEEILEFIDALLVIKKNLSLRTSEMEVWKEEENHEGNQMNNSHNLLTPDEIEEILKELEEQVEITKDCSEI